MIEHLLNVQDPLTKVLQDIEWDNLAASEWKSLHALKPLLQTLAEFTSLLSGDEFTTISCALPTIMDLNLHFEEMKSHSDNRIREVASIMQLDLKRRFRKFTDPSDSQYNPLYITATALDPRYRLLLNPRQTESAKMHLLKEIKEMVEDTSSSSECDSPRQDITCEIETSEPPPKKKRFRHLVTEQKWKEGLKKTASLPPGRTEIERYFTTIESATDRIDRLDYWIELQLRYPLLSKVAVDVVVVSVSSAPIERVFSTAGETCIGRRNRPADANLEREVMLKQNKRYL